MDIALIAFGALNFIVLLYLAVSSGRRGTDNYDSVELLTKLAEFKGDVVEKINEKNSFFLKEVVHHIDNLKEINQESLDKINNTLNNNIKEFQNNIFEKFNIISSSLHKSLSDSRAEFNQCVEKFRSDTAGSLSAVNKTLEDKIGSLQSSNEDKLEKMRGIVEEKLEKTLNERLKLSFDSVNKNLESVQKGLGEMQNLAVDVGGLKRAITNVKTRGVFGEVQLERILEQMLTPAQYEKNFQAKSRTQERVEFAIKLPGKSGDSVVYLPIDSKFPSEDYDALLDAYDDGDKLNVDNARKSFASKIKSFAKDISDKYINPPVTSDFAILFLPFESLYAEVVQTPGLFEELQAKYKIVVTGPTTVAAFLNALQIGFKTMAIEKRSAEVWNVLGAVKTEFGKFETALMSVQKNLRQADENLSTLVGTRTNAINRKLRSVHELSESDSRALLSDSGEEQ